LAPYKLAARGGACERPFARYLDSTGRPEPMNKYAQNFEDVTLRRVPLDIDKGHTINLRG
jgi:hypothetical protein